MKNLKLLLIFHFLLVFQIGFTQSPGGVSGVLAWFVTEVNETDLTKSKWVDIGPSQLRLEAENVPNGLDYENRVVSVNYNPALYFDNSNTKYYFRTKKNLSKNHTVIGVFIPKQTGNRVQYIMYEKEGVQVSLLKSDTYGYRDYSGNIESYDYGEVLPQGSDLLHGSGSEHPDESDRYGKIVTTNIYATPDYCYDMGAITGKLISLNSDMEEDEQNQEGYLPEFIVFDRVLTESERILVESYLSIKYGFSKYHNYESGGAKIWEVEPTGGECEKTDFVNRITGIGSDISILNQSRSTTYYDEDVDDTQREVLYTNSADYSNSPKRLLCIGIEDEMNTVRERWGMNSYLVWGDNDGDLSNGQFVELSNNPQYERVGRIWKSQYTNNGGGSLPNVSWCNYHDLEVSSTGELKRKYEETSVNDRVGICATTTGVPLSADGAIRFKITERPSGSDYGYIGFSSDNSKFSNEDFSYGIRIESQKIYALYDTDDDGKYDAQHDMGGYSLNQNISIRIYINQDNIKFGVNTGTTTYDTQQDRENIDSYYGKLMLYPDDLTIKDLMVFGVSAQNIGRVNVELSYERIQQYFPNSKEVYLLVNSQGDPEFPDNVYTKAYKCSYSETPGDLYNKLEWYGVPMQSDCGVFTFAKMDCEWEVMVNDPIYDCCGEEGEIRVEVLNCPIIGTFSVYINGTEYQYSEEDFPLDLRLENGEYSIQIISPEGDILYNEFLVISNPNNIPDPEGWQDQICFTEDGQIIQIDGSIPNSGGYIVSGYEWTRNSIFVSDNPLLELNESDNDVLGDYVLKVFVTCYNEKRCTLEYKVNICLDVRPDCELAITPNPCGGVKIEFTNPNLRDCRKRYRILNQNGTVVEGTILVNEAIFLNLAPGNYQIVWMDDECCELTDEFFTVPPGIELFTQDAFCFHGDDIPMNLPLIYKDCVRIVFRSNTIPYNIIGVLDPPQYSSPLGSSILIPSKFIGNLINCVGTVRVEAEFSRCDLPCRIRDVITVYDCTDPKCNVIDPGYPKCCNQIPLVESKNEIEEKKTSYNQIDAPSAVRIKYVNPIRNHQEYSFEMEISEKSMANFHVYNSAGQLIHQDKSKEGKLHDFKVTLPVGLYILKFSYDKGEEWIKIVAQ